MKIYFIIILDVTYSNELIKNAITSLKKIEFFISDCNNYVNGSYDGGDVNEPELLKVLSNICLNICTKLLVIESIDIY